jgi:hypothetical protein
MLESDVSEFSEEVLWELVLDLVGEVVHCKRTAAQAIVHVVKRLHREERPAKNAERDREIWLLRQADPPTTWSANRNKFRIGLGAARRAYSRFDQLVKENREQWASTRTEFPQHYSPALERYTWQQLLGRDAPPDSPRDRTD